jgi:hypothetical protein
MKFILLIIILILLYFFAIAPRKVRRSAAKAFLNKNYAHRGLFNNAAGVPENSLDAFQKAISCGYGIELDVQITKDEKVVVFHDDSLSRIYEIDLLVREKTYKELLELSLLHTDQKIPLLSQVLELVKGQIPLLIEIKLPIKSTRTCVLVDEVLQNYSGPYCIESFNTLAIQWYKKNRPKVIRGQLSSHLTGSVTDAGFFLNFMVENLLTNFLGRPDFISYCYRDTANLSYLINKHLFKAPTMAWTITSYTEYEKCLGRFDSFIFEGFHADSDI